jgi:hypothetical protein
MDADDSSRLRAAQRKLTAKVMGRRGVAGTAIGSDGGRPCLKVYLTDRAARGGVPRSVDGYRVVVEVSGRIERL